jgi:hypothetical protein
MRNLMRHQQTHRAPVRRSLWTPPTPDGAFPFAASNCELAAEPLRRPYRPITRASARQSTPCRNLRLAHLGAPRPTALTLRVQ